MTLTRSGINQPLLIVVAIRPVSTAASAESPTMTAQPPPYQLAFTLQGHAADVKTLAAPSPDVPLLLSGSRDGSAILWGPSRDGMWDVKLRVEGPEKQFINAVAMTRFQGEGKCSL